MKGKEILNMVLVISIVVGLLVWVAPAAVDAQNNAIVEWDKSSLEFTDEGGDCLPEGGEVEIWATVKNGNDSGNMTGSTSWELYYISSGNPKSGSVVDSGTIPALNAGGEHTMTSMVNQVGNYMFKAYQRPGHPGTGELWSEAIEVELCPYEPCVNTYPEYGAWSNWVFNPATDKEERSQTGIETG